MVGAASAARIRELELRWFAFLPVCLIATQVVFSAVELGLSYSRTMIVLGGVLGMTAALVALGVEREYVGSLRRAP